MTDIRENFINALVDLDEVKCIDILNQRVKSEEDPFIIIEDVRKATDIVGQRFEEGRFFVSDLMMAGEILNQIMEILKPVFGESKENKGTIVIGTVGGDVHDIGKNITSALLEAEGFNVIDLGVDQPPDAFIEAIKENKPIIVALSGLLTEATESMKITVDAIKEAGLRDQVKIIVGGGRTDEETREYTGADEWSDDATAGVRKFKKLAGVE
ncbi:cobalamin B12-binding domain-containing protein [Methanoplanus limicola]|uniref:Cobalamin B12-binding domain protein n=1 Tax=Methanoplanus limicola DSM 2279 TaxID=937775 RepID=H1Z2J3_9EURY|nr:corrinoid protein [Methanoplanus limicola]EHQ35519.1 cobalamin B12-binding domain protein [Methanoplanus limicola DSM 2279]